MTDVRLRLFGMPRIEYRGAPVGVERRKALALAAYLALGRQPVSRDILADLLWPQLDHVHARAALRSTLRALTTALPVPLLKADRTALWLVPGVAWVDVTCFLDFLARSRAHGHSPDEICEDCAEDFRQALELYQADFLDGFYLSDSVVYDDWQRSQTEWLRREVAGLLRRLALYESQAGRFDSAIAYTRRWLALDELHEPAHRLLMRLLAQNGQRSEALRQYRQCRELLDRELASPPEEETVQLYEAIRAQRPSQSFSADRDAFAARSVLPPLPSLIVGRDEALRAIKQRLNIEGGRRPLTVIQGWPGVGKSTMVAMLAHDPDVAHNFPDGILWVSLGEHPDLLGAVNSWAEALLPGEADRPRRIEEISAQLTATLRERRTLLIVDDVWQSEHVRHFRIGGQNCALVMTTRFNDTASALAPAADDIYRLQVLSEAAGLELLSSLTPATVAEHPSEARALIRDLEGLPLAIHVAGRLLHMETIMGWGIKELLAELRTGAALLEAEAPSDMLGVHREAPPTVAMLLRRSTNSLDRLTRQRFAYLGLFVPKPATFDLAAMAAAWAVPDPKPTVRNLVNRGLLEPVGGGRFQMHALLVLHARSLLEGDRDL